MSHAAYNQQWHSAHQNLADLLKTELPDEPPQPEKDRVAVFQKLATLFTKYVQIFRKLEQCYDQIVHPQKRIVIKRVLDGTMGRILEIKDEMVRLEISEYQFFDDVLSDLKLTPNDIEIPIPKYFINNCKSQLTERHRLLSQIIEKIQQPHAKGRPKKMSLEDAVRVIQVNERARQGRLRAKFMKEIRKEEERERKALARGPTTMDADQAAIIIQKVWKCFIQRKQAKQMRHEEMVFLGMTPPSDTDLKRADTHAMELKTEESRRATQDENENEYQQALTSTKEKMIEAEGPDMKETMQDQIRQWFLECKDLTGKLPDYPDASMGGSAILFANKTPEEVEEDMRIAAEEAEAKKNKKKEKKPKKENKKKNDKKKDDEEEEEEDPGWLMTESKYLESIKSDHDEYASIWKNRDESENFNQKHEPQLIKELKVSEVEAEVRKQVDELMREELKNLKLAIDREIAGKKKGKKGKKGKGKKGKGKKGKDLTEGRTTESIFEELIQQGILVQCPNFSLKNYLGDYQYLGTTLKQNDIEPQPSLSDVRQLVTLYGILPLGSAEVHESMSQIKSILITGPRGVGKKSLVHAICTESGANLFDLSSVNIAGRYPGKPGLTLLLNMVMRVATELQPSVIHIDNCDMMFAKKVPKEDLTDPKRLKKDLPKLLKLFKPEDRILLVGTSREPFNAAPKPFCKTYQKIIMVPRPDYASRYTIWSSLIKKHGGLPSPTLDISNLTKVTDGYTQGHIVNSVKTILTDRRVAKQAKKPLQTVEFVVPLGKVDPIYVEDEEAFHKWFKKTPLGKEREKIAKALAAKLAGEDGDDKKGKGKGKKGKGKKGKK